MKMSVIESKRPVSNAVRIFQDTSKVSMTVLRLFFLNLGPKEKNSIHTPIRLMSLLWKFTNNSLFWKSLIS
jgi:hypothetical protein